MEDGSSQEQNDLSLAWMYPVMMKLNILKDRPLSLSIFMVPNKLRKVNEDAYNPRIVSIGPFLQKTLANKDDQYLQAMENHKWWYTLYLIHRTLEPKETLHHCGKVIFDELVNIAFGSYAGDIKLQKHELSKILLIDGCFILELFIRSWCGSQETEGDFIFHNAWIVPTLQQDLALLENQIPFVILQKLYGIVGDQIAPGRKRLTASIDELALHFFYPDLKLNQESKVRVESSQDRKNCKHLLDLLHNFHLHAPTPETDGESNEELKLNQEANRGQCSISREQEIDPEEQEIDLEEQETRGFRKCATKLPEQDLLIDREEQQIDREEQEIDPEEQETRGFGKCATKLSEQDLLIDPEEQEIYPEEQETRGFEKCATKLSEAGIGFEKGKKNHLLGIEFNNGDITIPPLCIDEKTESLLRNLIAFEQCSPQSSHQVSSYVILLRSLIHSKQDIELLKRRGIITVNLVGDENVLNFFNNISREIDVKKFYFCELCRDVKKYQNSWWHWHKILAFFKVRSRTYLKALKSEYLSNPWRILSVIAAFVLLLLTAVQTYYAVRSYLNSDR